VITSMLDIANMALSKLGAKPITSFLGTDPITEQVNLYFQNTIDEVLTSHSWSCATFRETLAEVVTSEPLTGYRYRYQLPSSPYCLFINRLFNPETGLEYPDIYRREGRHLLTNYSPCGLIFTGRLTEPADFDTDLVQTIVLRLAYYLAPSVSRDTKKEDKLLQQYYIKLTEAQSVAEMETNPPGGGAESWGDIK
jgi:hypothetical protein